MSITTLLLFVGGGLRGWEVRQEDPKGDLVLNRGTEHHGSREQGRDLDLRAEPEAEEQQLG